jgi:hypothetical protein
MKYAVEMGSSAVMYVPNFIKSGSGIQKLMEGFPDIQTAWTLHKPTFIFSKQKK